MNRVARPRPELATSGRFRPRFWDFRRGALTTHLKMTSIAPYFMLIHFVLFCSVLSCPGQREPGENVAHPRQGVQDSEP
ncbi:conserved hypothetical protein [Coccidioides posadasii str. Silveira]|uniref:Uncharacterized protein n=1 Tax=Coccidioides posadasii (strain RMSCC 757 / Silveira) TaxID=443226 RepID=E9DFT9_COCPS|nr:conserved hypothetical protein [Coccidioides posadasii str. Silveira]